MEYARFVFHGFQIIFCVSTPEMTNLAEADASPNSKMTFWIAKWYTNIWNDMLKVQTFYLNSNADTSKLYNWYSVVQVLPQTDAKKLRVFFSLGRDKPESQKQNAPR